MLYVKCHGPNGLLQGCCLPWLCIATASFLPICAIQQVLVFLVLAEVAVVWGLVEEGV